MAYRISQVMTKTGDKGQTGLADGSRVKKDSLRIQAIGDVDELNSLLGLVISFQPPEAVSNVLLKVQHQLFEVGGELSLPGVRKVTGKTVAMLEDQIVAIGGKLPPLNGFVLPRGTAAAAQLQVARSVCRRAERSVVALDGAEKVSPDLLCYLNRLSDLLFILARETNRSAGCPEILSNEVS
ncbi:MAG: cob(I)yrinic acid a,c-diamide adenosyltransferase [Oxalobacter sp.]|nr:cob(I)yrinic acid a,c-diamide adenosyltransferase [Oxalobacter sp.]